MNKKEIEQAQELIDQPITEENLQPLVPTFPEKSNVGLDKPEGLG